MTPTEAAALAKDMGDLLIRDAVREIAAVYEAKPDLARDPDTMKTAAPAAARFMAVAAALYAIHAGLTKPVST